MVLIIICSLLQYYTYYHSLHTADEAEHNFSEDDGWEFVTLADQVIIT